MLEKPFYGFIVQGFVTGINDALQKEVCLLQLVPEKRINFREFKRLETVFTDGFGTHHIQSCEKPATTGWFLVGDAFRIYFYGEMSIHSGQILLVEGKFADVIVANGITQSFVGTGSLVTLFDLVQHRIADTAFPILRLYGK